MEDSNLPTYKNCNIEKVEKMSNFLKCASELNKTKKKHKENDVKERTIGRCTDDYKFQISLKSGGFVLAKGPNAHTVYQFGRTRKYLECKTELGEFKNIKVENLNLNDLVSQFEK